MEQRDADNFLKEEYFFIQKTYEDFDNKSLTIKGWITSGSGVSAYLGLKSPANANLTLIAISGVCLIIWLIEANWKLTQKGFADRIRSIEAHFRGEIDLIQREVFPLQIYSSWHKSHHKDAPIYPYERDNGLRPRRKVIRFIKMAVQPNVIFPYLLIISVCGAVYASLNL